MLNLETKSKLLHKLRRYPDLKHEDADDCFAIWHREKPEFEICLDEEQEGHYVVSCSAWHEHFDTEKDVLNFIGWCFTTKCRLRTHYRGEFPTRWKFEYYDGKDWIGVSETGLFLFPFWRAQRVEYVENRPVSKHNGCLKT